MLDIKLLEVGYFLSMYGKNAPPVELKVRNWKEAYLSFYPKLGGDKTEQEFINSLNPVAINGFETKDRTFGKLTVYKIKIKNINGAIIIPERSRHEEEIMEIIAPYELKKKLGLKDNSKLKIIK